MAAVNFLSLLEEFRRDLLQDCAVFMAWYPDHPMWSMPGAREIFLTPEFREFSAAVRDAILDASHEDHMNFSMVLPSHPSQIKSLVLY